MKDKTYSPQEEGDANGIRFEVLADSTLSAPIARIAVGISPSPNQSDYYREIALSQAISA